MNNQTSKSRKFCAFIAKAFYVCAIIYGFIISLSLGIHAIAQLGFIILLISARFKNISIIYFIPDELLFALPYFWAINAILSANSFNKILLTAFLIVFSLSLLDSTRLKGVLPGGWSGNNLKHGIWWTIVFYFLMATALRTVFPHFTLELYKKSILNGILFFGGLPISISAFYDYYNLDKS